MALECSLEFLALETFCQKWHGMFCPGWQKWHEMFVRDGKSLWDVLSRVSINGMGCFAGLPWSGSESDVVLRCFLSRALVAILFGRSEPFRHIGLEDIMRNVSEKLF